jgi:hypothetical protein
VHTLLRPDVKDVLAGTEGEGVDLGERREGGREGGREK